MQYLYDEQHYIDRYDLYTIEECLDYYWSIRDRFAKEKDTHFAKYTQEKLNSSILGFSFLIKLSLEAYRVIRTERVQTDTLSTSAILV